MIDEKLKELNDDYEVERKHALKEVRLDFCPKYIHGLHEIKGKIGGQHKFPRVLKGKMLEDGRNLLQRAPFKYLIPGFFCKCRYGFLLQQLKSTIKR